MLACASSRSKHKSEYGICFTWLFPCLSMVLAFFFFFILFFFFFFFRFRIYGLSRLFHSFWAESIVTCDKNGRSQRKTIWQPGPLGQSDAPSYWYSGSHGFEPRSGFKSYVEIGHEIISMVILSLPLIQVRQLLVNRFSTVWIGITLMVLP